MDPVIHRLVPIDSLEQQRRAQDALPMMYDASTPVMKLDVSRVLEDAVGLNPQRTVPEVLKLGEWVSPSAYHLADLDFWFQLTGYSFWESKKSQLPLVYLDIGCGSPGFAEYIQYRCPLSIGYGVYWFGGEVTWDPNVLSYNNMDILGNEFDGEIEQCSEFVTSNLAVREPEGVHLVTIGSAESVRELAVAITTGLRCLQNNGNMVFAVPDVRDHVSQQLCRLMSACFSRWTMMKTVVSGGDNSCYFVGLGLGKTNSVVNNVVSMLTTMIDQQWIVGYNVLSMMDTSVGEEIESLIRSMEDQKLLLEHHKINWGLLSVLYDM